MIVTPYYANSIGSPKESDLKKKTVVHYHEGLLKLREVLMRRIQQKLHQ